MTPQGQPTTSALQALVQDGTLTGSWILDPARSEVRLDAEVPVNRADFGLTYSPLRMASLDNTITVHAVFTRQ